MYPPRSELSCLHLQIYISRNRIKVIKLTSTTPLSDIETEVQHSNKSNVDEFKSGELDELKQDLLSLTCE